MECMIWLPGGPASGRAVAFPGNIDGFILAQVMVLRVEGVGSEAGKDPGLSQSSAPKLVDTDCLEATWREGVV